MSTKRVKEGWRIKDLDWKHFAERHFSRHPEELEEARLGIILCEGCDRLLIGTKFSDEDLFYFVMNSDDSWCKKCREKKGDRK